MNHAAILGQVGIVIAVPIALGAWLGLKLDEAAGTSPWGLLGSIFAGMVVAGGGVWALIRRYTEDNPIRPSTERAREAGRRWEAEIRERERRREAEEEVSERPAPPARANSTNGVEAARPKAEREEREEEEQR